MMSNGTFDWNTFVNASSYHSDVAVGSECAADVTLRLDSPCSNPKWRQSIGSKRKRGESDRTERCPGHASLALSLGPASSLLDISKGSSTDEESSFDLGFNFQLRLNNDNACSPIRHSRDAPEATEVKHIFGLQLSLSAGLSESTLTNSVKVADEEGSASSELKLNKCYPTNQNISSFHPVPAEPVMKSSVNCTSGKSHHQQRTACNKNCQFEGCSKGARGASGLCISHGGGRRCQKFGCQKGAEGRTVYCKAHGGGRRCQHLGCTKSAEGRTDFCIAHGGGRRCSNDGCTRAARGKSGLCIRHGGGKRCQRENCTKSAEGFSGLCISHGGGRRCQFPACTKGAQGSTIFCKAHGGGKRCDVVGCTKGAEGSTPFCKGHGGGKRCSYHGDGVCSKSVHGGTQFCVAHGGGKRCSFPNCTKSARGRTDYCVRHGGGKRCKLEACGKSAQGSTDFCKAHGGGKRCSWGQPDSVYSTGGSCDRFARGKVGLCSVHGAVVQDDCIHGGGTLRPPTLRQTVFRHHRQESPAIPDGVELKINLMTPISTLKLPIKQDIKEDIRTSLRTANCGASLSFNSEDTLKLFNLSMTADQPNFVTLPEGRVHGGRLMAMLSSYPDAEKASNSPEFVGLFST